MGRPAINHTGKILESKRHELFEVVAKDGNLRHIIRFLDTNNEKSVKTGHMLTGSVTDRRKYEGLILHSNNFGSFKVIKYLEGKNKHSVKFLSTGTEVEVDTGAMLDGQIRDRLVPTVMGVGYLGYGKYKFESSAGACWNNMLTRCYSEKYKSLRPTYNGCEVCKDWLNLQSFAMWYEDICTDDSLTLDKDILYKGNKIYSPNTCTFVPNRINDLFGPSSGDYPIGVSKRRDKFIAECGNGTRSEVIGHYDTPIEAFYAYKTHKETLIKVLADEYKCMLTSACYDALYNYQVDITD